MNKRNGLDVKNKIYIGVFLGVFFALICPIMINKYFGLWNASDALSYWGTLLGAVATIIAVIWTIDYSKKLSEKERKHTENTNYKNCGMQICFDFIELCSYKKIIDIINKTSNDGIFNDVTSYNFRVSEELEDLSRCFLEVFMKFITFHPNLTLEQKNEITSFEIWFSNLIEKIEPLLKCTESNIMPEGFNGEKIEKLIKELNKKNTSLHILMQEIIFNYDYSIDFNEIKILNPS